METLQDIRDKMWQAKENEPALSGLNSTSKVSIFRLIIDVVAQVMFEFKQLFELNKEEISEKIDTLVPHTPNWYRNKVLGFQSGFDLLNDSDKFDNRNATNEEIQDSKIVKQCAVYEADDRRLIVKVAKEINGEFEALNDAELFSLRRYMGTIKDAGVKLEIISIQHDKLLLDLTIHYNPLLLDANGVCLRTGDKPVNEAVKRYLKKLPFNGKLSLMRLIDEIQNVEGVEDLKLNIAQTAWLNEAAYNAYEDINISVVPHSGWFKEELHVSYDIE